MQSRSGEVYLISGASSLSLWKRLSKGRGAKWNQAEKKPHQPELNFQTRDSITNPSCYVFLCFYFFVGSSRKWGREIFGVKKSNFLHAWIQKFCTYMFLSLFFFPHFPSHFIHFHLVGIPLCRFILVFILNGICFSSLTLLPLCFLL